MTNRIYLDYSATTPVDPEVLEAMMPFLREGFGNPSSTHSFGRQARLAVEGAREQVAAFINARPSEIVFTASGTESDNMAIVGVARLNAGKRKHVLTCRTEHHAVIHAAQGLQGEGFDVEYVPCDQWGRVQPGQVDELMRTDTCLVSIMHANNEIGTINAIGEIGLLARSRGVLFHTDAVQSYGKVPIDVKAMGIDLLSASAHKFYGPKGVGFLYVRQGVELSSLIRGGSQERNQRAGTENVSGIVAIGKATEICQRRMVDDGNRLTELRKFLWEQLQKQWPSMILNGHPEERLPGHLNISFPGIHGDDLMTQLDLNGFAVSTGSACASGAVNVSHVLEAMGKEKDVARGAVRISLGRTTQERDLISLLATMKSIIDQSRA